MCRQPEITGRDLRTRSHEIIDALENGQAFTITRHGHPIGTLVPSALTRMPPPIGNWMIAAGEAEPVTSQSAPHER